MRGHRRQAARGEKLMELLRRDGGDAREWSAVVRVELICRCVLSPLPCSIAHELAQRLCLCDCILHLKSTHVRA